METNMTTLAPGAQDPEGALRALWTAKGVPIERQDEVIAQIKAAAQPGARVGPWTIPDSSSPKAG